MTGIMAAYSQNDGWKEDVVLKEEMAKYVKQGLQRREMLDFLKRNFAQYAWCLHTIDRGFRHFEIYHHDKNVLVEELKDVGPGRLLRYRAMHQKVRQVHDLNDLRPEGSESPWTSWQKENTPPPSLCSSPFWLTSPFFFFLNDSSQP